MQNKVLIVYESEAGTTRQIAEIIGKQIEDAGLVAYVFPTDYPIDTSSYRAVIAGSSNHIRKWKRGIRRFVKSNYQTLVEKKIWFFSILPCKTEETSNHIVSVPLSREIQQLVDQLKPVDVAVFASKAEEPKVSVFRKFLIRNQKEPNKHVYDVSAIRNWATTIAQKLSVPA